MAIVEGGKIVAASLKRENVKYLFTLCGGTIESIYEGCLDEGIRIIDVRIDQSATMMADAWARVTATTGVSAVTRGPGHANSLYGLATAYMIGSPLIAISGQSDISKIDMGASQEYNQVGTVKPLTKWSRLVYHTHRLPEYISSAFRMALSGRPGPVHLSIPYDVLYDKIDDEKLTIPSPSNYRPAMRIKPDPDLIQKGLRLLENAKRPVVIAGGGIHWSGAAKALTEFIEASQLPLFTKFYDVNSISKPHPLYFGKASQRFGGASKELCQADVVLTIGLKFDETIQFGNPPLFHPEAKFIVVDVEAEEMGRNRTFEVGIIADAQSALEEFISQLHKYNLAKREAWIGLLTAAREHFYQKLAEAENSEATPVHPLRICKEVRQLFGDNATIALDGGDIHLFAQMSFNHYHPSHFLVTGPIGGIGHGVPFAIAGKLARPDSPCVLISGDGAIGYGVIEYDIALKHNIPFVAIVSMDQFWGIVRHPQIKRYGLQRAVATDLRPLAYEKIVEAIGGYGELVKDAKGIRPALQRAVDSGVPALINVPTQFCSAVDFFGN